MIRVRPLDVALFKDGKPFTPGEGTRTRSFVHLPPPETLYGALRHLLLQELLLKEQKVDLKDYLNGSAPPGIQRLLGSPAKLGDLRISGPFLEKEGERQDSLLPWPADAIRVTGTGELVYLAPGPIGERPPGNWPYPWVRSLVPFRGRARIQPESGTELSMDTPDAFLLATGSGQILPDNDSLRRYLKQLSGFRQIAAGNVFCGEPHTGLATSRETRTAVEGALYTAEFLRADNRSSRISYSLDVTPEPCWEEPRLAGMGGERRPFSFQKAESPSWRLDPFRKEILQFLNGEVKGGELHFRLFLLTPARFLSSGWLPDWIDPATGCSSQDSPVQFQLLGAALPKPVHFSGWDLVARKPKPTRPHVPPGAVYFFKATTNAGANLAEAVMSRFWLRSIHGTSQEQASDDRVKLGLGISLVGGISIG